MRLQVGSPSLAWVLVTLLGSTSSQFFQGISASSSAKAVTSTTAAAATGKTVTSATFFKKNDNEKQAAVTAKSMHSTETDLFSFEEDGALMKDIEYLSSVLADIVRTENPHVHELYTRLRKHGLDRASDPNNKSAFEDMKKLAFDISPVDALGVMRIFSLALNLVNCAEVNHKNRNLRRHEMEGHLDGVNVGPLPMIEDSARGTMEIILGEESGTKEEIYANLLKQQVEIVLTAHPTEVNRRTIIFKYKRIVETLASLDRPDLQPYERSSAKETIRRTIAAIWGSDEIRRIKPTPQDEAAGGNAAVETVLWDAIPSYLRKLDAQCEVSLGKRLPIDVCPIKFASWMGGDRDGNPNVTPEVTKEVILKQRLRCAKLYLRDFNQLYSEMAISSKYSDELEALASTITESKDKREKYRRIVGHLSNRLLKTVRVCEAELAAMGSEAGYDSMVRGGIVDHFENEEQLQGVEPIFEKAELMEPLKVVYDSLTETGFGVVADGFLLDIIRRLSAFGVTLVPLDIREESTRHTLALDSITQYLGLGSYKEWDEEARINFLQSELSSKRPLINLEDLKMAGIDENAMITIRVFETISKVGKEALGAYVISQAQTTSDVLAVMLLQKEFGMTAENGKMMRVVPLFETLNDLTNAPDVLTRLFKVSQYIGAIKGKQEVMVGYSDSAKDAGRLSACWAQYTGQERMVKVANDFGIELTFFHGKGGTVGRGGNPALYRAILSHPPNTIEGRFRVTEQGEMIRQNFGSPLIAERTLDKYTAAVLRDGFVKHVEPSAKWRKQMERISAASCADYRYLVRDDPRFVPYFRQATPELELGTLNIGSRPAKRKPKGGIESLRAIPWTFAWGQSRLNLSAWLGVGKGLKPENEEDRMEMQEMYKQWPWFREIIDLLSLILSKTDYSISQNYDDILVDKTPDLLALGDEVREKLVETRQMVLEVSGSKEYGGPHVQLLRASSKLRNPYVDSINCVQAELLKELRNMSEEESEIRRIRQDALVVSIKGIAQGMKNSG